MKIKYIFEESDLSGFGQYIIANGSSNRGSVDYGYLLTVLYKISWGTLNLEKTISLVSMQDGMTHFFENQSDLLDHLNEFDYRPATNKEILKSIETEGNRFPENL